MSPIPSPIGSGTQNPTANCHPYVDGRCRCMNIEIWGVSKTTLLMDSWGRAFTLSFTEFGSIKLRTQEGIIQVQAVRRLKTLHLVDGVFSWDCTRYRITALEFERGCKVCSNLLFPVGEPPFYSPREHTVMGLGDLNEC
jgi:hypothetical protein